MVLLIWSDLIHCADMVVVSLRSFTTFGYLLWAFHCLSVELNWFRWFIPSHANFSSCDALLVLSLCYAPFFRHRFMLCLFVPLKLCWCNMYQQMLVERKFHIWTFLWPPEWEDKDSTIVCTWIFLLHHWFVQNFYWNKENIPEYILRKQVYEKNT